MTNDAAGRALDLRGVSMRFGEVRVLDRVDFAVEPGSVHAVVGHNGAGKSTLMKIALGVHQPTEGSVHIAGSPLTPAHPATARKLGLGMVMQERSLIDTLSGLDNLFLNDEKIGLTRAIRRRAQRQEALALTERLGISPDVLRRQVSQLSPVEQQMLEIAKAVRLAEHVLILDEPTAPLSHREIEMLFRLIRRVAGLGAGIVLITHHLNEVFEVADHITVLRGGKVTLSVAPARTSVPDLISSMLGESKAAVKSEGVTRVDVAAAPALEVRDLTVPGKFETPLSFSVKRGEIVGVAGLAGSGRSTLLRALFGAARPGGGAVRLMGQSYRPRNPKHAIRNRLFLIPEERAEYGLVTTQPIVDNIMLPVLGGLTTWRVVRDGRGADLAHQLMRDLKVRARDHRQVVNELSGGNQQKIVLAKSLATRADMLLLDEPTSGVDVGAAAELIKIVGELANQGTGVLWVTSDLQELLTVSDRVLVIADGRIRAVVPRDGEDFTEPRLIHLMQRAGLNGGEAA
ncbi:sugar ABC transporter ATP-binding protein [Rhizomonospora bruguierae]|uniref:sugar ABC transporter ATP-binding protein n=1 Tax=Rhizomonospora bruguierae TaxID=1581705 RepID=UPI001BCB2F56|nr:sugar ABC transporter ATP-binding protein [Micromonospora sp. NBRC 107566]